ELGAGGELELPALRGVAECRVDGVDEPRAAEAKRAAADSRPCESGARHETHAGQEADEPKQCAMRYSVPFRGRWYAEMRNRPVETVCHPDRSFADRDAAWAPTDGEGLGRRDRLRIEFREGAAGAGYGPDGVRAERDGGRLAGGAGRRRSELDARHGIDL